LKASAFLYPWDVVGDPDAARRIADLGVTQVSLAAAYHSTRTVTPRHPAHRVVTARHSAVLYPPSPERWRGRRLRPYEQRWVPVRDAWQEAATTLTAAGIEVHTWVVLTHNSRLGTEFPDVSTVNAYGDRYPWALCTAQPDVLAYATALAAEAGARPGAAGAELEACGWFGYAHLHAHDKVAGVRFDGAAQYLMSLCFCAACVAGYAERDVDAEELGDAIRRALAPVWRGEHPAGPADPAGEWARVETLIGADLAAGTLAWRTRTARAFQRSVVAAVRAEAAATRQGAAFQVLLHADPATHRCGANTGVDPADVLAHADGVVLPCTGGDADRAAVLGPFAAHRRAGTVLAANFTVVSGMGGDPATLAAQAAHAAALGADQLRLYHAGLACDSDLDLVREALKTL
jgi:hypothetical protein